MRRFFIDSATINEDTALITGSEARHLLKVLRLPPGAEIELFDGNGWSWRASIIDGARDQVRCRLLTNDQAQRDGLTIDLGQALLKGAKMELVVQKCTELGVAALHPFLSTHCKVPAPGPEKLGRWQRIIQESCKQCNQPWPPTCHPARDFAATLAQGATHDLRLICWEQREAPPLRRVIADLAPPSSIMVLIGPEGGFTRDEVTQAGQAGFLPAGLGRRTLRAETAAIAVIALLQYIFNDLD